MSTFAIDPLTNDLLFVNGELVLVTTVHEEVAIVLNAKFQHVKGGWFLDVREGFPWFEVVLVKNPDLQIIKGVFRQVILDTQGVTDVTQLELAFDSPNRVLTGTFRVLCDDGVTIVGGPGNPFIVEYPTQ